MNELSVPVIIDGFTEIPDILCLVLHVPPSINRFSILSPELPSLSPPHQVLHFIGNGHLNALSAHLIFVREFGGGF
jgi:hypothetical protein